MKFTVQPPRRGDIRSLLLAATLCTLAVTVAAEPIQPGDTIKLIRKEPLLFREQPFRDGEEGETFAVLANRPEIKRVFVLLKGQDGKDIAVSVPDDAVTVVAKASTKLRERAVAAAKAGRLDEATRLILEALKMSPKDPELLSLSRAVITIGAAKEAVEKAKKQQAHANGVAAAKRKNAVVADRPNPLAPNDTSNQRRSEVMREEAQAIEAQAKEAVLEAQNQYQAAIASATALTAERQDRNLQSATTSPPSQPIALNDSLPTTDNTIKANRTPESIVDGFLRANNFKTIKDSWKNGETPLQIACVRVYQDKDNITLIKALVSLGANVDANDHSGETPLQAAVLAGSLEAVELLVAHGAHVNQADREGKTALFACASSRSNGVEIAKLLVNRGASMSVRDSDGQTPLHLAALHYATDLVRFYLSQKIDLAAVDTKGRTALHNAASKGERDAVISLIEAGADPGVRDLAGEKPAYLAAGGGHGSLAEALASADRARNGRVRVAHSSQSFAQVTNPPESVLRSYLDAKQWPDKLPFVRSPSRVEPLMRQYYSEGYEGGQSTMGKLETDAVGNSFIEVKFAKGGQSRFYVTLVDGKCLVDWEASVGWSDMSGVAFQAKKPPFPVNMRGIAKLDSFYNPLTVC